MRNDSVTRGTLLGRTHGAGKRDQTPDAKEAARFLRLSASFLAKKRMHGDGPRYRKLSRAVRYLKSDLLDWLKACAKTSTSEGHVR